jgi:integrase
LSDPTTGVESFASLPRQNIKPVMRALASTKGTAARCVAFTILTTARSIEARHAKWTEIDLVRAVWTVPRMKGTGVHRIPLSPAALIILDEMARTRNEDSGIVFPHGNTGKPLSYATVSRVLRLAAGRNNVSVHGCRRTFATWCGKAVMEAVEQPDGTSKLEPRSREIADAAAGYVNSDWKPETRKFGVVRWARWQNLVTAWAEWCVSPDPAVKRTSDTLP